MTNEEWKDIEGWESKYKVSNTGRVWNTFSDVELAQVTTGIPPYKYVNLRHKGEHKLVRVHRLVGIAFLDNPDNLPMLDHIDRNKFNNCVENLRWVDNSGNQRNTDSSVFVDGVHLLDFVKGYKQPDSAYKHISTSLSNGYSTQEAISRYAFYDKYGYKTVKVQVEGEEVYLLDLCNQLHKSYTHVAARLRSGYELWNALYDVPSYHAGSFQVHDNAGVGHWYKNVSVFEESHMLATKSYKKLISEGKSLEDILSYNSQDYLRQTVMGFTGTIKEMCVHFGKTESAVGTRRKAGMSLEEALTTPLQRVKKVNINGVSNTPKYWYESFGLPYKLTKYKKDKGKWTFEETLQNCGVDISNLSITYGD